MKPPTRRWQPGERRRILYIWRWWRRWNCHESIFPCQYVDDPNDNHGG